MSFLVDRQTHFAEVKFLLCQTALIDKTVI